MIQFEIRQSGQENELEIIMSGILDEDAKFPEINRQIRLININLKDIKSINSCGIREWIKWITPLSGNVNIHINHCPKVIVDQINMVDGFLPKGIFVDSFFVPYYCESIDETKNILLIRGKDYEQAGPNTPGKINVNETMKFEGANEEFELDVIESRYFKFLVAS